MARSPHIIYLDHNATTPLLPAVEQAMREAQHLAFANPASQHAAGRQARQVLEQARDDILQLLGGTGDDRLVFTSGGTEANNLALLGMAGAIEHGSSQRRESSAKQVAAFERATARGRGRPASLRSPEAAVAEDSREDSPCAAEKPGIVISTIEHPSVIGAADELIRRGWHVGRLPVDVHGVVRLDRLEEVLTESTRLVSIMLGNNETGVLQPLPAVVAAVRAAELKFGTRIVIHTDAVQVVGKLPVDFRAIGVDAISFAAHKFHGPRGIGGLLLSANVGIVPLLHGGVQQAGLRPGTESPVLAAGMYAALATLVEEGAARVTRMTGLRDRFERGVLAAFPGSVVSGQLVARLPHTSNIGFPGLNRQALLMALDLDGVCCSTGSACASGSSEPSPVLIAMGSPADIVAGSLRFSLGAFTTEAEIDEAIVRIGHRVADRKGLY